MGSSLSSEITRLLADVGRDQPEALRRLLPLVYHELHDLAERALRHERRDHTLQATALVNEAYLRLSEQQNVSWQGRSHFVGIAATLMRRILVDHARGRNSLKRGGDRTRVALADGAGPEPADEVDLEALDQALGRLAALDERQARIVELRYFGGLTIEETAGLLDASPATVKRDWNSARAWLRRELAQTDAE